MPKILVFIGAFWAGIMFAAPQIPLDALQGQYPILQYNQDSRTTGIVSIISSEKEIGLIIKSLKLASTPVPEGKLLSPAGDTIVSQTADKISQRYSSGKESLAIDYHVQDGYLVIAAEECDEKICSVFNFVISSGKSPGEKVDAKAFLSGLNGNYKIELVGGQKPKDSVSTAGVLAQDVETIFVLPYCPPGSTFCDPGYVFFRYETTQVFKRATSEGSFLYDIFLSLEGETRYYTWESVDELSTFRNIQYEFENELFCMEHVLRKTD